MRSKVTVMQGDSVNTKREDIVTFRETVDARVHSTCRRVRAQTVTENRNGTGTHEQVSESGDRRRRRDAVTVDVDDSTEIIIDT
jgi:hypothetical protein